MTCEEAMDDNEVVTRAQAIAEAKRHGWDWNTFRTLEEPVLQDKAYYRSRDILVRLGY